MLYLRNARSQTSFRARVWTTQARQTRDATHESQYSMFEAPLDERALRETLASCRAAADASHASLRQCANLAPAGTGSKSLASSMRLERAFMPTILYRYSIANRPNTLALRNASSRSTRGSRWDSPSSLLMPYRLVTHKHFRRLPGFAPLWTEEDWARAHALSRLPPHDNSTLLARCFVMTVRDPATRLASAFRSTFQSSQKIRTFWANHYTAKKWIAAVRAREPHAMAILNRSYTSPRYRFERSGDCCDDVEGGNNFLTSQVDYLVGAKEACSRGIPVHIVCTETLDDDFKSLVAATNKSSKPAAQVHVAVGIGAKVIDSAAATSSLLSRPPLPLPPHHHHRSARFESGRKAGYHELYLNNTEITEEDADYVRNTIYRLDGLLHAIVCPRSRKGSPPTPWPSVRQNTRVSRPLYTSYL